MSRQHPYTYNSPPRYPLDSPSHTPHGSTIFPPSSRTRLDDAGNEKLTYGSPAQRRSGCFSWKWALPLLLLVVIAAVVGGGVGATVGKKNSHAAAVSTTTGTSTSAVVLTTTNAAGETGTSTSLTVVTTTSTSSAGTPSSAPGAITLTPLRSWNWGTDKAIGMCLGNWLILERWMNEDWIIEQAGPDAWDEWSFSETLGTAKATTVLTEHWNTWITKTDIQMMYNAGINILRIPVGFWAFIPTVSGEPYVNMAGQIDQIERILAYAYDYGMHAVIDLHGLPGSQNGEESSGHNTTSPSWFDNTANQNRSDNLVSVVMDWIATNPYRSVIAGIEVINEPRPYTPAQEQELANYYQRSYDTIQASAWPVAMFIHGAFITNAMDYWYDFVAARVTDPPSVVYEDHPYPGNFPIQTSASDIMSQICTDSAKYLGYPVPVCVTEWSIYTGVKDTVFENEFYEAQAKAWAWSAGGMYWSWKLIPSSIQLAAGLDYSQYSFYTLLSNSSDVILLSAKASVSNTTTASGAQTYLSALKGNCGDAPDNVAPYNNGSVTVSTWSAELAAQSSGATQTLKATATQRPKHKRESKQDH